MENDLTYFNKKNGVFYTPPHLAEYLAAPLIGQGEISVLDPAYGEGALLLAAEKVARYKNRIESVKLFGCDIKPVNGLLSHLPEANLQEKNFFQFSESNKFSLILMNPPYVRHHFQNLEVIEGYKKDFPLLAKLTSYSDLWAYFLLKASLHLKPDGNIGAILPWSFLQADYAQLLRQWLYSHFRSIRILALSGKYFEDANERVVLVWLRGFGTPCDRISMAYSKFIHDDVEFTALSSGNWLGKKVTLEGGIDANIILASYKDNFGFKTFDSFADVKIGVVTGADRYFILNQQDANLRKFGKKKQIAIVTSTKQFSDVLLNGDMNLRRLIVLTRNDRKKYWSYICKGVKREYNLRAHSRRRDPWYAVKVGKIPNAFFPYRSKNPPYLLLNNAQAQCTNSIHRIYFKGLNSTEVKWLQMSLLSEIGQLSLEVHSKTYGKGILKIEPSALMGALVVVKSDKTIANVYDEIISALKSGERNRAITLATAFLNKSLGIPDDLSLSAHLKLTELRAQRESR